ncbi:MAG TPA: PhzF family phenazine biosynthesis protein [Vicinamibacterales bacterium]|nr:PhzF family phenazine biosynthesis protein [Vicinamibacterales bacterium]
MPTLRYLHLDVFTDRALEGNQLAVFPDARGLDAGLMQRIAREMAFSETTFILPPERAGGCRMRIFTPGAELPIAGHPTVGSTFALAAGGAIAAGQPSFVFELAIGPTPVTLEWNGTRLDFVWMTQPLPVVGARVNDRHAFAAAIGIGIDDLMPDLPIEAVSCGNPFVFAPLRTRQVVDRVTLDRMAFQAICDQVAPDAHGVFVFSREETDEAHEVAYSRMLAPGLGIGEDPATGSASGPLGCYLVAHGLVGAEQAAHMVSVQGVRMGRPSRVHIAIELDEGRIAGVRVGGRSVLLGDGTITI